MKITSCKTRVVSLPLPQIITTAIHHIATVGCVLLELHTDEGMSGESYVFTLNGVRLKALQEVVHSFLPLVEGKDPHDVTEIGVQMWQEMNPIGHAGFPIAALCAIDTACWDIVGKAANRPVHKLFGGCRERIHTYASGGLWLSSGIDECVREATQFVEQGFKAVKLRAGHARVRDDLEKVHAVREAIDTDIELLVDVNQGLSVKQAMVLLQELEAYDITWLEEPVDYQNHHGYAQLRAATTIPIAAGETEYTRFGLHQLLQTEAVDVLMADLQRVGGLSEFRRVAALASVYHIPLSTHMFTEHSLCIAGSEPNCQVVEHMPWFSPLFNESLVIDDGCLIIPERAGIGFTFSQEAIERYRID